MTLAQAASDAGASGSEAILIVAIVSATVALMSLLLNLALYRLSGARLELRLIPAVLTSQGHLLRGNDRGWRGRPDLEDLPDDFDAAYVDLAIVKVTNVGRAAVSVSDIALDFGRYGRTLRWRNTIASRPVVVHECKAIEGEIRLDTGQSFSVAMDHEPLVEHALARMKSTTPRWRRPLARSLTVRATATGAGRRPTRSAWRRRWKARTGDRTIYYQCPPSDWHEAFLAVFRSVYPHDARKLYEAWCALRFLEPIGGGGVQFVEETLARVLGIDPRLNFGLRMDAVAIVARLDDCRAPIVGDDGPA